MDFVIAAAHRLRSTNWARNLSSIQLSFGVQSTMRQCSDTPYTMCCDACVCVSEDSKRESASTLCDMQRWCDCTIGSVRFICKTFDPLRSQHPQNCRAAGLPTMAAAARRRAGAVTGRPCFCWCLWCCTVGRLFWWKRVQEVCAWRRCRFSLIAQWDGCWCVSHRAAFYSISNLVLCGALLCCALCCAVILCAMLSVLSITLQFELCCAVLSCAVMSPVALHRIGIGIGIGLDWNLTGLLLEWIELHWNGMGWSDLYFIEMGLNRFELDRHR